MPKKRTTPSAPDLKAETVAILLGGWSTHPPDGVDPGPPGFGGGFIDLVETDGPALLWRAHEAWLLRTAAAWHWTPTVRGPDGTRRFYGAHCAAGFSAHEAAFPDDPDDVDA